MCSRRVEKTEVRSEKCPYCGGKGCERCHNTGANLEPEEETLDRMAADKRS